MFLYRAYGLGVRSEFRLPGLPETGEGGEILVRGGAVERFSTRLPLSTGCTRATPEAVNFLWESAAACKVVQGREIVVEPFPGVGEELLSLYILGPALGVLLHQRGGLVLHGSAVTAGGGAVVFLGESGWGKSSVAAAFHARGRGLLADDMTWVDPATLTVTPGIPRIKLWPDSAEALGFPPNTLARLHPDTPKVAVPALRGFSERPAPLRCIYVLSEGESRPPEPLPARDAFLEILKNTYAVAFLSATGTAGGHFAAATALAREIPVRRLTAWGALLGLPRVVDLVEEDLSHVR